MRKAAEPTDLVFVALASAFPSTLSLAELARKAGNIEPATAQTVVGDLLMEGYLSGSSATGYALTEEGVALIEAKFERSTIGAYTSFSPRRESGSHEPGLLKKWFPFFVLTPVLIAGFRGLMAS